MSETGIDKYSINVSGSVAIPGSDEKSDVMTDKSINVSQKAVEAADIKEEIAGIDLPEDIEKDADSVITKEDMDDGPDNIPDISQAVLYEDSSNIIDYDNNDSKIDTTLDEYKKIRRIGEGNIEILGTGINFRAGKKLFRFDFQRMADIKNSNNFIALRMKGSDISRLFLFKRDSLLSTKLKEAYNKFSTQPK